MTNDLTQGVFLQFLLSLFCTVQDSIQAPRPQIKSQRSQIRSFRQALLAPNQACQTPNQTSQTQIRSIESPILAPQRVQIEGFGPSDWGMRGKQEQEEI